MLGRGRIHRLLPSFCIDRSKTTSRRPPKDSPVPPSRFLFRALSQNLPRRDEFLHVAWTRQRKPTRQPASGMRLFITLPNHKQRGSIGLFPVSVLLARKLTLSSPRTRGKGQTRPSQTARHGRRIGSGPARAIMPAEMAHTAYCQSMR